MAQIPYTDGVASIQPDATPGNDYQSVRPSPEAFGGGTAQALDKAGAALDQTSTQLSNASKFFGEIQTNDALQGAMGTANSIVEKFRTLRGADALRAQDDYNQQLDETFKTAREGLTGPLQQKQFDDEARTFRNRYLAGMMSSHADQQAHEYGLQTSNAAYSNGQAIIAANPNDDDAFSQGVQMMHKARVQALVLNGMASNPDAMDNETRQTAVDATEARINSLLASPRPDDLTRAKSILDANRDVLSTSKNYDAFSARVEERVVQGTVATFANAAVSPPQTARAPADYYRANYSNIIQDARDSAEKAFPGDTVLSDRVAARTEQKMNDAIRQQELSYKFDSDTVFKALDGSMTKGRAPSSTAEMEAISPQVASSWQRMQANNPQAALQVETHLMTANSKGKAADYGSQFYQKLQSVLAPPSDLDYVSDPSKLLPYIGTDETAPLTNSGFGQLGGILNMRGTPQGEAFTNQFRDFLNSAHGQISASDQRTGLVDPKGDARFNKFLVSALDNMQSEVRAGTAPTAMFDPKSKNYIGQSIYGYIPTPAQKAEELMGYQNVYGPKPISPAQTMAIDTAVKGGSITADQGASLRGLMRQFSNGLISRRQAEQQAGAILPSLLSAPPTVPTTP